MTTLFRPVGLHEVSLIWDSGMREFPPRLPHQPIFYPVANIEYATQIARDWNPKDEASGFAGYVTKFVVREAYIADFDPHTVGASAHVEYWIPAASLSLFNAAIEGLIIVEAAYFGNGFKGYVPEKLELRDKDVVGQFVVLSRTCEQNRMNFAKRSGCEPQSCVFEFPVLVTVRLHRLRCGRAAKGCDHCPDHGCVELKSDRNTASRARR